MKIIITGQQAREKMLVGVNTLADMVRATIGPQGRNVVFENKLEQCIITNDGHTIAKEVDLSDPIENMGAQILKEVASKTNTIAGDGTTTATTIAQSLANGCFKLIEEEGINPMILRKRLNVLSKDIIKELEGMAIPVNGTDDICKVGTISSADESIGRLIATAMDQVGSEGIVTIEEGIGVEDILTVVNGMEFERGYLSGDMVTNKEKRTVEYHKGAKVLIIKDKLSDINRIVNVLDACNVANAPLLIIVDDITPDVLEIIASNGLRGGFACTVIQSPGFGDNKLEVSKDIAAFTGATIIDNNFILSNQYISSAELGEVELVDISRDKTVIVGGHGEGLELRKTQIKNELEESKSDFEKEKLKERLANIAGGVALISVGARTETELVERKLRIEDALNATKAATEEGIVAGGGYALYKIAMSKAESADPVEAVLIGAIMSPIVNIIENTGECSANVLLEMASKNLGYDAFNEKYVDMIEAGIIDPLKVTKNAFLSAVSVVSTLITVEGAIGLEK